MRYYNVLTKFSFGLLLVVCLTSLAQAAPINPVDTSKARMRWNKFLRDTIDVNNIRHELALNVTQLISSSPGLDLMYRKNWRNVAFRGSFSVTSSNQMSKNYSPQNVVVIKNEGANINNYTNINSFWGAQWQRFFGHFGIYIGADLNLGYRYSFNKQTTNYVDTGVTRTSQSLNNSHSVSVGIVPFLGARYLFAKRFSIGAEINLGAIYSFSFGKNNSNSTYNNTSTGFSDRNNNSNDNQAHAVNFTAGINSFRVLLSYYIHTQKGKPKS